MILILAVVMGALFGVYWKLASTYISPPRNINDPLPGLRDRQFATLGKETPCWCTANLDQANTVFVLAHGYGGSRATWSEFAVEMEKRGYASVIPSMPGQDTSTFDHVGFGTTESDLLIDVVKDIRAQRGDKVKVILGGKSMGGAACWLAAGKSADVDAIFTEGAFARFDEAMNFWFDRKFRGAAVLMRPLVWITRARTHIDPSSIVPLNGAEHWKGKPALVIQAAEDQVVPTSHAQRLAQAAACPEWTVPNARHVECYEKAKDEYLNKVDALAKSTPTR